jgi:type II secretory pathway predicted ATPase ExeA
VYESYYGLERRPFRESVDPAVYLALPSHEVVLRRVHYALEQCQGPAIVYGPPGTGKTLLARRLASQRAGPVVHVTYPALPAAELVVHLAEEFGKTAVIPSSLNGALRQLRSQLAAMAAQDQRPLLVVDEAQLIDQPASFEVLRLLLNFASDGTPDLDLLLVGGGEVLLDLPSSLADRLAAWCLLGPLTEAESPRYIQGRLRAAGATAPLFSPPALASLHRLGSGRPRRLNRLADLALLIAHAQGLSIVEEHTIAIAAREFDHDLAA